MNLKTKTPKRICVTRVVPGDLVVFDWSCPPGPMYERASTMGLSRCVFKNVC